MDKDALDLADIATEFREGILNGRSSDWMCAAVSYPLASYLRALHGVDCKTVEGDFGECNHVWIETADGRVIDPTLDQFNKWFPHKNYPAVWVGPTAEYKKMMGLDAPDSDIRALAEMGE